MFEGWDEKVSAFFLSWALRPRKWQNPTIERHIFFVSDGFELVAKTAQCRSVVHGDNYLAGRLACLCGKRRESSARPTVALGNCQHLRTNTFKYLLRRIVEEDSSSDCASPARNSYLRAGYVSGCRQKRSVRHVDSFLWFDKYHVASNLRGTRPYCR